MRLVSFAFAATSLLAACGSVDPSGADTSALGPCKGIHCGQCNPDPSSRTGGSRTCEDCSGDSWTQACTPVCKVQVRNVAGSTLPYPFLISAYWGSYFTGQPGYGDAVYHDATWYTLATSTGFWSRMSEYGIGHAGYTGGYFTNASLSSDISDADIQTELCNEVLGSTGGLPPPAFAGQQIIYIVYLPSGVRSTRNTASGSTGYHDSFNCTGTNMSTRLYYAVLDGVDTVQTVDLVAAHEIEEATTDSILGQGWNVPNMSGGEIADLCAPQNEVIDGRLVPKIWSQQTCSCK
jgi:hypothetical protein